ncbi:hypothetical protein WN944_006368 [Citrus x changshan-huyou]|uniref:RNase H type-1 domain-containing protein n=1 Tax=Citrus x changshan-huyou TaxID=2935761 RepID=A0AAP0MJ17_9ROSI
MLAAPVVVNLAVKNSKEPWKHVFHVVMDQMNLGAIQVMFKLKDYNGAHIDTKVNTDAAIYVEEHKVGLGIIIRDSNGDFVAAAMKTSKFIDNIAYAEAQAIYLGMKVAKAAASGALIIESYCSEVVNQILGKTTSNLELSWIISEIQNQMQRVKDIKV